MYLAPEFPRRLLYEEEPEGGGEGADGRALARLAIPPTFVNILTQSSEFPLGDAALSQGSLGSRAGGSGLMNVTVMEWGW